MGNEDTIVHNYIKSNDFKTGFTTSVFGGVTVNGLINVNFCVDRTPIPTKTESLLDTKTGTLTEISKETKEGVVREVQFGTLLDVSTAEVFVAWLNDKITAIKTIQAIQEGRAK